MAGVPYGVAHPYYRPTVPEGQQLGFLPAVMALVSAGETIAHDVSSAQSAGASRDAARKARADAYLTGVVQGHSVTAARLALGAKQTNTAKSEQQLYDGILAQMRSGAPDTFAQAQAAGALHDAADGKQGLQELLRLGIPFSEPGAGRSTTDGSVIDQGTQAIVAQLARLAAGPVAGGGGSAGSAGSAGGAGGAAGSTGGTSLVAGVGGATPWILALLGGGLMFAMLSGGGHRAPRRARVHRNRPPRRGRLKVRRHGRRRSRR